MLPPPVLALLSRPSTTPQTRAVGRGCHVIVFFGSSCGHCLIAADSFGKTSTWQEKERTLWLTTPEQSTRGVQELLGPGVVILQLAGADTLLQVRRVPVAFAVDQKGRILEIGGLAAAEATVKSREACNR